MPLLDDLPADVDRAIFSHLTIRSLVQLALTSGEWARRVLPMVIVPSKELSSTKALVSAAASFEDLDAVLQGISVHPYIQLGQGFTLEDFQDPVDDTCFRRNNYSAAPSWDYYEWPSRRVRGFDTEPMRFYLRQSIKDLTSTSEMLSAAKEVVLQCIVMRTPPDEAIGSTGSPLSAQIMDLLIATTLRLPPELFLEQCKPWFETFDLQCAQGPRHHRLEWRSFTAESVAIALSKSLRRREWTPALSAQLIAIGLASSHGARWSQPCLIATLLNRQFPRPRGVGLLLSQPIAEVLQIAMPPQLPESQCTWFHFICSDLLWGDFDEDKRAHYAEEKQPYFEPLQDRSLKLNVEPLIAHATTLPLPAFYRLVEVAVETAEPYSDAAWGDWEHCDEYDNPEDCFRAFLRAFIVGWTQAVNFPVAFPITEQAEICNLLAEKIPTKVKDLLGRDVLAWIKNAQSTQTVDIICDAFMRSNDKEPKPRFLIIDDDDDYLYSE